MVKEGLNMYHSGFYDEAVGVLTELIKDQGFLIARISKVTLALPPWPELEDKLRPLIGKRIGVLRTDIPQKEYLVRIFPEEESLNEIDQTLPNAHREKASA
jgi:hypothetical protein